MLNLINPFSRKDKPDTSFLDRVGIAALALLIIALVFIIPLFVVDWYRHASRKSRIAFWICLIAFISFGEQLAIGVLWLQRDEASSIEKLVGTILSLVGAYFLFAFFIQMYKWLRTKLSAHE